VPTLVCDARVRVTSFRNPVDDVPAIEAEAELSFLPTEAGGLPAPLPLPSPSLVFRDLDAEGVVGYTVMIADDVPREKVWEGREFALWHGTDRGSATILRVAGPSDGKVCVAVFMPPDAGARLDAWRRDHAAEFGPEESWVINLGRAHGGGDLVSVWVPRRHLPPGFPVGKNLFS
jgi:hypothetical protein